MVATPRLPSVDSSDVGKALGEMVSAQTGITAFAGGGQGSATAITRAFNRITTCATGGDSVKLPKALPGAQVMIANRGAAACNVFPQTGEAINALSNNTALSLGINAVGIYSCALAGKWEAGTLT
jgi:hypothetical protein